MSAEINELKQQVAELLQEVKTCKDNAQQVITDAAQNWGVIATGGHAPSGFCLVAGGVGDLAYTVTAKAMSMLLSDVNGIAIRLTNLNLSWAKASGSVEYGLLTAGAGWRYVWLVSNGTTHKLHISSSSVEPVGVSAEFKYWRYLASIYVMDANFLIRYMTKDATGAITWLDHNRIWENPIGVTTWKEFNHATWVPPHAHNVTWDVASGVTHGCFRVSWVNGGADAIYLMHTLHTDDWCGYQYNFSLAPNHKSLWLYTTCGNQTIGISMRGYKEQPL